MGIRVPIHRPAGLFDLAEQRPLSARRGKTRGDTDRDRHTCAHEAENGRLETYTCCLTPEAKPARLGLHAKSPLKASLRNAGAGRIHPCLRGPRRLYVMSVSAEHIVVREPTNVMLVRVADQLSEIQRAWASFEACVGLR